MEERADRERRPLSFPQWKETLAAAALAQSEKTAHTRAIIAFLGFCKRSHAPASIILIKAYLAALPEQERSGARDALRWFVLAAERQAGGSPGSLLPACGVPKDGTRGPGPAAAFADEADGAENQVGALAHRNTRRQAATPPPSAASDLGGADWERDLINACRERHFLWRTEETYRMWGNRFARSLSPRSPYAAEAGDVAAFLSRMAVEERASVSAQKQALNALVFLMQEALHRELGRVKDVAPRGFATEQPETTGACSMSTCCIRRATQGSISDSPAIHGGGCANTRRGWRRPPPIGGRGA